MSNSNGRIAQEEPSIAAGTPVVKIGGDDSASVSGFADVEASDQDAYRLNIKEVPGLDDEAIYSSSDLEALATRRFSAVDANGAMTGANTDYEMASSAAPAPRRRRAVLTLLGAVGTVIAAVSIKALVKRRHKSIRGPASLTAKMREVLPRAVPFWD